MGGVRDAADPHPGRCAADPPRKGEGNDAAGTRDDGEFGNVRVLRHEARHAAQAKARAEPIDKMREIGRLGCRQSGLHRIEPLRHQRGKPHHVEAEAGIAFVAQRRQPIGEQPADARGIAQRRAGADLDALHLAVGAKQRDLQLPRPFAAAFQDARKFARQMLDGGKHVAFKRDRLGEALLGDIARHRQARRDRLVFNAQAPGRCGARARCRSARRAAARGLSRISATCLRPTCASAATVSDASRNAATGSGASAARVSELGTR